MAVMGLGKATVHAKVSNGQRAMRRVLEIALAPRSLLWLMGNNRGLRIRCTSGALWITQDGDPVDYCLGGGEQFTVTRRGPVLLQGIWGWKV